MIYQLPNGKIINISIEVYLKMSDDDLKYLNEADIGSYGSMNPFVDQSEQDDVVITESEDISNIDPDLFSIEEEYPED